MISALQSLSKNTTIRLPVRRELEATCCCSKIFTLPVISTENITPGDIFSYRGIVWNGKIQNNKPCPNTWEGYSDVIINTHNFYVLVEVTTTTGVRQWTKEFASSISHLEDFIRNHKIQ
ncbi:MAG: AlwI family type II restriction endonuclease, partial [Planctomycetota bacterium]|nr:AlwI family type II restriction endonuclease [Planctomycetota bacterium]